MELIGKLVVYGLAGLGLYTIYNQITELKEKAENNEIRGN